MRPVSEQLTVYRRFKDVFEEACLDAIPDDIIATAKRDLKPVDEVADRIVSRVANANPPVEPPNKLASGFEWRMNCRIVVITMISCFPMAQTPQGLNRCWSC